MHLVDTLDRGGAERTAVNLVNYLPRDRFRVFLCTTRRDGALARFVAEDVQCLQLGRKWRLDPKAFMRLILYIRAKNIRILHAHGTSLFVAAVASLFAPSARIVWHDNYGRLALEKRPLLVYRALTSRAHGLIVVNQQLLDWARQELRFPAERAWLIPNFGVEPRTEDESVELPGDKGCRIVCVANFRPEKDHLALIRAMRYVVRQVPSAHLLLLGGVSNKVHEERVRQTIVDQELAASVSILGARDDVFAVLRGCDIGVLSSASEGLPLALLEYGVAGLPVVVTDVGHCREVVDGGRAGLLVPAYAPDHLAAALLDLLNSPTRRGELGTRLHSRVQQEYSVARSVGLVSEAYNTVLEVRPRSL